MDDNLKAYLQALDLLIQPVRQGDYPAGLDPMRALLAEMGQPQQGLRAVVVTGSSGKGSTCARIARHLRAAGLNVGLYTSPHLHSFRERFVLNDAMIDRGTFAAGAQVVAAAAARVGTSYSTFEQATALALWWFAQQQPDFVVLEIGLGGRWDAVNVVDNLLAVFTRIEAEHVAMLGGSLESVAWHKAGIIKPDGWAVSAPQATPVWDVLRAEADAQAARLVLADAADLSRSACQNLADRGLIPSDNVLAAIEPAHLPGRLEMVRYHGRQLLIDGGHTPAAAHYLRAAIERLTRDPVRLVVGMLNDKDARAWLATFDTSQFHVVLTRAAGHRAAAPDALASSYNFQNARVEIILDLDQALAQADDAGEALFVVAGSLRMVAYAREYCGLLSAAELEEALATRALFEGETYLSKLTDSGRKQRY